MKKLVIEESTQAGGIVAYRVRTKSGGRKKRRFKIEERLVRQLANVGASFFSSYGERHRKSGKKKKDGWLTDIDRNLLRASRRGSKKLKVRRIVGL